MTTPYSVCEHEFVDLYAGWSRDEDNQLRAWVFCKHCLTKRLLTFDMSWEMEHEEE